MKGRDGRVNPWLLIPAAVYEGHMRSPRVRQLQFLSAAFREALDRHRPVSVAVVGCATGNGFEHVDPGTTRRVVAIDINPEYIALVVKRYAKLLPGLQVIAGDVAECDLGRGSMDLVHCALVLEYVGLRAVIAKAAAWLREGGVMSVVLQVQSVNQEKVSETEFKEELAGLEPIMRLVDPGELATFAEKAGFRRGPSGVSRLESGKEFWVGEYVREGCS